MFNASLYRSTSQFFGHVAGCDDSKIDFVMAGLQLCDAAYNGRVDVVRRLLDQGVHPDEHRGGVSATPAAAGGACTDALCWGAPLASRAGSRR